MIEYENPIQGPVASYRLFNNDEYGNKVTPQLHMSIAGSPFYPVMIDHLQSMADTPPPVSREAL